MAESESDDGGGWSDGVMEEDGRLVFTREMVRAAKRWRAEYGRMAGEEREKDGCPTGMGGSALRLKPFNETVIYASLRNHKT